MARPPKMRFPVSAPAPPQDEALVPRQDLVLTAEAPSRVSPTETIAIGLFATQGRSVAEIAELMGRSPETVRRHVGASKDVLKALAPEAIEAWRVAMHLAAQKGNHAPARDLVQAAGVAAPVQQPTGPVIQIGIALPGLPLPPKPTPEE